MNGRPSARIEAASCTHSQCARAGGPGISARPRAKLAAAPKLPSWAKISCLIAPSGGAGKPRTPDGAAGKCDGRKRDGDSLMFL